MYKQFNRRVFLALLFCLFASRKSSAAKINTTKCEWCWLGAVTNNSITIKAKLSHQLKEEKNYLQVLYHQNRDLSPDNQELNKVKATAISDRIATFNLTDLAEDTVYYYVKSKNGAIAGQRQWGLLNFSDDGNKIEVKVELKRMEDTLIRHTFVFD